MWKLPAAGPGHEAADCRTSGGPEASTGVWSQSLEDSGAVVCPLRGETRSWTQCLDYWQAEPALESGYRAEGLRAGVGSLVGGGGSRGDGSWLSWGGLVLGRQAPQAVQL